ncbi:kinase-like domain-containing protein [Ganoderma leucocontextum]|nr:kinase-like domain-containing protein [Ganoderma leucocontextum]
MPRILRIKAYQCLMYFGHKTSSSRVTRLPFGLYAKRASVTEALATQCVSTNTTIPVPTILDVFLGPIGKPLILMTRASGTPLGDMPLTASELSDAQLSAFTDAMTRWLAQLRQLGPPPSEPAVCGFMGTPFMSYRIDHSQCVGPFSSSDEFHSQYYCTLPPNADPQMRALAKCIRQKPYRICFTHGDLSPSNILVDEDYVPIGLIDWGCAAWMPEYWELTSSIYRRQRYKGWVHIFKGALPQYEEELAVEMELWKFVMPW